MAEVTDIDKYVLANMAGKNFEPSAHWEILTTDGTFIIRDKLNDSNGYQCHAPIASGSAREEDPIARPKKHNYEEEFDRPLFIQYIKNSEIYDRK